MYNQFKRQSVAALMISLSTVSFVGAQALETDKKLSLPEISTQFASTAIKQMKAGDLTQAQFTLEKALVANPKNADVLVALGEVHEAQGRVGKGLKYYRQALMVEPTLKKALKMQALAFLKKDLPVNAEMSKEKLHVACAGACEELAFVSTAITAYKAKKEAELMAAKDELKKEAAKEVKED